MNSSRSQKLNLISDIKEHVLYLQELGMSEMSVALPQNGIEQTPRASADKRERVTASEIDGMIAKMRSEPVERENTAPVLKPRRDLLHSTKIGDLSKSSETRQTTLQPPVKSPPPAAPVNIVENIKPEEPAGDLPVSTETLADIHTEIGADCTRCSLCENRTRVVNSVGSASADLMIVGEAPGADEDAQGEPFVGRAGKLLTKILEAIGFERKDVFIGNINRCRPQDNRQPTLEESAMCKKFLIREIAAVRPKVIVVLGNTATQNLLDTKTGITKLRGNFAEYYGVKVMPTFHPAYLLRDPRKKREVWDDMKKVREYINSFD